MEVGSARASVPLGGCQETQDLPNSSEKNGVMRLLPHNRWSLKEILRVCNNEGMLQRNKKKGTY